MSERSSSRQEESDMIDPRLEPNFGFDFLDQNRLDSVEFDSQGRGEERGEGVNRFIHTLSVRSVLSLITE